MTERACYFLSAASRLSWLALPASVGMLAASATFPADPIVGIFAFRVLRY